MRNIAFIPLRGGSVSIPLKNIKLLDGRPLAYYALDAATQCELIDTVIVATDADEIATVIKKYDSDKIVIVGRTPEVSTNFSPTMEVVREFSLQYQYERMVLIQATSPLISSEDVKRGLLLLEEGYDSVLSVVRQHRFIWNEETHLPNFIIPHKPRRQDWMGILVENGAFYINSRENILRDNFYLSGNIGLCEMSEDTYIEIDSSNDWFVMEQILKQKRKSYREK